MATTLFPSTVNLHEMGQGVVIAIAAVLAVMLILISVKTALSR